MQIDTVVGLGMALTFGVWAYLDYRDEKSPPKEGAGLLPEAHAHVWRGFGVVIVALIVVVLTGVSAYLFAQVPALLWEMTAGLLLGSLSLRLLFRIG
jgi:hypothetical protein